MLLMSLPIASDRGVADGTPEAHYLSQHAGVLCPPQSRGSKSRGAISGASARAAAAKAPASEKISDLPYHETRLLFDPTIPLWRER